MASQHLSQSNSRIVGVEDTLVAENTFSDWTLMRGHFNFSLSSIGAGTTVHLQRRFQGEAARDVEAYTAVIEDRGYEPETDVEYRFGVKTGNYTAGDVVGRISRGS